MEALFVTLVALVLALLLGATVLELLSAQKRRKEALYLVSRVGDQHGFEVHEKPLSLKIPGDTENGAEATVHYHLLAPGDERDSITLKARTGGPSRLGNLLIDNDPARIYAPGMRRVALGSKQFDPYFRIFAQPERAERLRNQLGRETELLFLLKDLARRTPGGHFELDDLSGTQKIQFDDDSIRFPSDVEEITDAIVRLYRRYRALAGI